MTLKEMPRVGGGHGSSHKIHPRLHRIDPKKNCFLRYGWGYIGRGLKGGFKPKSGPRNQCSSIAQKINIGSLGRKSGRNLLKKVYF